MKDINMLTLFIYVNPDNNNLRQFYQDRITAHNNKIDDKYADSGFDLGMPYSKSISNIESGVKLPLEIQCSMYYPNGTPQAYYLYPRSSIVKTPLRLANSVGIIDRGYRGPITAVVDKINNNTYRLEQLDRYFQICHPSLNPFQVILVDSKDELGLTDRDEGGFGSTGR